MSTFAFKAVDVAGVPAKGEIEAPSKPVSYTHLTLPTILRV